MQAQSIVMLVDGTAQVGADGASTGLREVIERHMDRARWRLVHCESVESAQEHFQVSSLGGLVPELVVLNVDVQRGWPFCSTLKKSFASIPVIVVSHRLAKEVFSNHQKLDTRADAYHRLPDEHDGLEISLSYFSSHKSETGQDDEGSSPRAKVRKGGRVAASTAILQQLEMTVAEQARAIEDARRQIEALEAERDAVADKNRRQVLELMALTPGGGDSSGEAQALRERIATLEAQALNAAMREDELRQARAALTTTKAELARLAERPDAEGLVSRLQRDLVAFRADDERLRSELDTQAVTLAELRTERDQLVQKQAQQATRVSLPGMPRPSVAAIEEAREDARKEAVESANQLAKASVQLSSLATELKTSHERRLQAEEALKKAEARAVELEQKLAQRHSASVDDLQDALARAEDRAEAAERAWSAASSRGDQLQVYAQSAAAEVERLSVEKKAIDDALAMSRRLMREYATDAARKAEDLKAEQARVKELTEQLELAAEQNDELAQSADFDRSLAESLEKELAELKSQPSGVGDATYEAAIKELEERRVSTQLMEADLERALAECDEARLALDQVRDEQKIWKHELERRGTAMTALAAELESKGNALQELFEEHAELSQRHAMSSEAHAELTRAHAEVITRQAELAEESEHEHAETKAAMSALDAYIQTLEQRFCAVRDYAKACESRLVDAESGRAAIEDRLEAVVTELRSHALRGEVPPPMDIPARPRIAPLEVSPAEDADSPGD